MWDQIGGSWRPRGRRCRCFTGTELDVEDRVQFDAVWRNSHLTMQEVEKSDTDHGHGHIRRLEV